MKLHLLQKLFSLIAWVYPASSGQCQEKSDQIPLTGQQKADLERALTLNKQFGNLYSQGKYAEATPLAIENLNILGICISPSIIFNYSMIKLFILRLYRVARKLSP
jgi:hypothetical protein